MSTKKVLEHKGFQGSVDFSIEDGIVHGKILHIADMITYDADSVPELVKAFEEAVDDYLETCEAIGKKPDKPFSGTFNVRIGAPLHMAVAKTAAREDKSVNEFVREALDCHVNGRHQEIHHHYQPPADYTAEYLFHDASSRKRRPFDLDLQIQGAFE
ncbi:type II toxin-antitoxin system HicB family antitoxin [Halopseudomonas salina]|uniref:HicB family protein n=1 Tax=Halopseudomonas salina TaxID=1323744 RepID=A0ABQ1NXR1_9GAMM|nr:type II toxin-antitoxin system HicB family antitoxin [Halopseudomonas salina]GGC87237.1 hypothetical protein GCM10007418_03780 [Halopseudomonas salina]